MRKQDSKEKRDKRAKNPFAFVTSFSKVITMAWVVMWVESILFAQAASWFGFGDTMAITTIGQTITEIGAIICGFYFSTKCLENIAKGYENWKIHMSSIVDRDDADSDAVPYKEEDV